MRNYSKQYYQKHEKTIKGHSRKFYEKNKETIKEKHKKYYQENKEKIIEKIREWKKKNKEKIKGYNKKYYQKNKNLTKGNEMTDAQRILDMLHPGVKVEDETINASLAYQAAVDLMDDELREKLHSDLAPCSDADFLQKYMEHHKIKFQKDFGI